MKAAAIVFLVCAFSTLSFAATTDDSVRTPAPESAPAATSAASADAASSRETLRHELRGGAGVNVNADHYGATPSSASSSNTEIRFNVTYGFMFDTHFELLADLYLAQITGDGASSSITPEVGLAFNFSDDHLSSFFVGGLIGEEFFSSTSSHTYTALILSGEVGKRIPLAPHVAWIPEFFVTSRAYATSTESSNWTRSSYASYRFIPFQLAFLF